MQGRFVTLIPVEETLPMRIFRGELVIFERILKHVRVYCSESIGFQNLSSILAV